MYKIIWKYSVAPKNQKRFEKEYGSSGRWTDLFKRSNDYLGSTLHKSDNKSDTEGNDYLLIDCWNFKNSYDDFLSENKQQYQQLNGSFQELYLTELAVGTYNSLP